MKRRVAYYAAHAALSTLVLAVLPPLRSVPLGVPVTYERDGLFLTVLTKAISEDGLWHASRIGAPFGTDMVDWPLGIWLPFAQLAALTRLLGEPGLALNVYWLSTIVLAGLLATYALRRLRLAAGLAFVLGALYAFQPYAFYRNVEHVNLAFPFLPLLALLCMRVAGTRPEDESRGERALTLAACVAQGLSYVYYSAFACALLAAAALVGWWRTRRPGVVLQATLAVALLGGSTLVTVAPTLSYWRAHGYNPDLDYKPPRETDTYGMKLRHLLVPISEHPLAPWRTVAEAVDAVDYPGDNENTLSKLGTLGSIGLLALLGLVLARAAGAARPLPEPLPAAAALSLATLLLANVGGLASFFSVFVTPDVRAWGRIVVLLSFFCLLATGTLLASLWRRAPEPWKRPAPATAAASLLLAFGLLDSIPLERLAALREGTGEAFEEERAFVHEIESRLPRGGMVFQLPHMTVPVDRATLAPMQYYDPGRMFVHSRTLRWSWGAMIGRNRDWGRAVDALPLPDRLRTLALSGFSAVWIDRWGYTGDPRPRFAELEREIEAILGRPPIASTRGRYSFFDLGPYRTALEASFGKVRVEHLRDRLLADMPIGPWVEGCGEEHAADGGWWRTCGAEARFELRNWRPGAIRVTLTARLRAVGARSAVIAGPGLAQRAGFEERVELGTPARSHTWVFDIGGLDWPARRNAPCPAEIRIRVEDAGRVCGEGSCFEIADIAYETRRLIGGIPVNPDGGVARRTKY